AAPPRQLEPPRPMINPPMREQTQQDLRGVLDSLSTLVAVLAPGGALLQLNRSALDQLATEGLIGQPFDQAPCWSSPAAADLAQAILAGGLGQTTRFDADARGLDGRDITLDLTVSPVRDDDGRIDAL